MSLSETSLILTSGCSYTAVQLAYSPGSSSVLAGCQIYPDTGNIHRPIPNRKPFTPPPHPQKLIQTEHESHHRVRARAKTHQSHRHLLGDDVATVTPPPQPVAQGEPVIGLVQALPRYDLPRIEAWPGGIVVTTAQLTRAGSLVQNPSPAIGAKRPADTDARFAHVGPFRRYKEWDGPLFVPPFPRPRPRLQ